MEYGIDSDGFFALPALPERVAVVGAGYIAVELAGVINGLGAKTHLFVRKHAPLRSFDPMLSETLVEVMNAEGPQLHTNAIPKAVVKNADGSLTLELEDGRSETVDCLIWAIGREPANDNINLEAAGVKTNEKGYIVVDKYQNTNVEGIYAVGDNTGAVELTRWLLQQVAVSLNACLITSRMSIWITATFRPWSSAIRRLVLLV